ncbi:MAG: hypothetical protein ABW212_20065 [Pseudonocardia sediminis]
MKVLVATKLTQGRRTNDYDHCIDGELVLVQVGVVCARDRGDPDGGCGCGRGFGGLNSHRATTTALVADVPLTRADHIEAIRSSLVAQGWREHAGHAAAESVDMSVLLAPWPVGAVVERRLDRVLVRTLPAQR